MSITIHIEGLDLAGKSTICRFIRDNYGFKLRNNALTEDNPLIKTADDHRKNKTLDDSVLGSLYLNVLRYDLAHYHESDQTRIVQDSTIIVRSIAFHSVVGDPKLAVAFRQLLPDHPRFTRSCVLRSSDEVRLKRLQGRCSRKHDSPEDHLIYTSPELFHKMENIIIDLVCNEFGGTIIDSSEMEREGEKERLASIILGSGRNE